MPSARSMLHFVGRAAAGCLLSRLVLLLPAVATAADKATLALQREGFAAAKASASITPGAGGDRLMIDVVEGPRQMAAGIEITGLPDDLSQELKRWLKSQRPPLGAVPQAHDVQGGWSGTRWIDARGQPARMEMPAWRRWRRARDHLPQPAAGLGPARRRSLSRIPDDRRRSAADDAAGPRGKPSTVNEQPIVTNSS